MVLVTSTWTERRSRPDLASDIGVVAGRGNTGQILLATSASAQRKEI
jgi:hypothetical protein